MRAMGFCAGVGHAHFMAREFNKFGYSTVALDASTPWTHAGRNSPSCAEERFRSYRR